MELPPQVAGFQVNFGLVLHHLPSLQDVRGPAQHRRRLRRRRAHHRVRAGTRTVVCWSPGGQGDGREQRGSGQESPVKGRISDSSCREGSGPLARDARPREAAHGVHRENQLLRAAVLGLHFHATSKPAGETHLRVFTFFLKSLKRIKSSFNTIFSPFPLDVVSPCSTVQCALMPPSLCPS